MSAPATTDAAAMQQQMQSMFQQCRDMHAAMEQQRQHIDEQNRILQQYQLQQMQHANSSSNHSNNMPKPAKPDLFKGASASAQNWLYAIEQYFHATQTIHNENFMIHFASASLRDQAAVWWRSTEKQYKQAGNEIVTWDAWKKAFLEQYQPKKASEIAREKLYTIHQGGSVSAYCDTFNSHLLHITDMSDTDQLFQFLRGLHPDIYSDVKFQHPKTLLEAQNYALKAELDVRARSSWFKRNRGAHAGNGTFKKVGYNNGNYRAPSGQAAAASTSAPMDLGQLAGDDDDANEEVHDHESTEEVGDDELFALLSTLKPLDEAERKRCMREGRCFRCRQTGHRAQSSSCPLNKFNTGSKPKKY